MTNNNDQSIQSVITSTDHFLQKSSHFYSKFLSDYAEPWTPESERKWCRGWGHGGRWHHSKLGQHPEAVGHLDVNANWDLGNGQVIELDKTKQTNLWAFPVPSSAQDQRCRDLGGDGVWTRESVWRCLFPADKRRLQHELEKAKNGNVEGRLFGDYTDYLDWKAGMKKATQYYTQQQRYGPSAETKTVNDYDNNWKAQDEKYQFRSSDSALEHISQSNFDQNMSGEKVISTISSTETFKKPDGTLGTKHIVKKEYADGSTTTTERITSNEKQSGWFWK
jgi:hypothetical protein